MGWWKTERGKGGDGMADYLDNALKKIGELEIPRENTLPLRVNMTDLADAIEFCSRGIFKVEFNPEAEHLKNMEVKDIDSTAFETFPNRGQLHSGTANQKKKGAFV